MNNTTVVIKTIGRKTLKAAVDSAKREGFKVIVVSDGVKCHQAGANQFVKLGKKWGYYGGMATNVGAALASTEYITLLDDDDTFILGAGDIIRNKLTESPETDIWIGGVRFNTPVNIINKATGEVTYSSRDFAIHPEKGLVEGNVAMPTYRTDIFSKVPFTDNLGEEHQHLSDLAHVIMCNNAGYKVDWFGEALYNVRPHAQGSTNGGGK